MCGQIIPGLEIDGRPAPYPVVNERAVRATAGLLLLTAAVAFSQAYFLGNFLLLKTITPILFVDFVIRVLTGLTPLSPFGVVGTLLVRNQTPEWVGATQKKFAWSIGSVMALLMTFVTNLNITGALPLTVCLSCIGLMWMEAALGVCVGCQIFRWLVHKALLRPPDYVPACPGGVCDRPGARVIGRDAGAFPNRAFPK